MSFFGSLGRLIGIGGGNVPDLTKAYEELSKLPEYSVQEGYSLNPQDFKLEDTSLGDIVVDPRYKEAQLAALTQLSKIGQEGGLTTADRASLQGVAEEMSAQERGQREAIAQQARARGLGGSGVELAQQLITQQGSSQRAAQEGRDIAKMAQQRALDALMNAGTLGGNIRTQEYSEQANEARARDIINQYNMQNKMNLSERDANMLQRIAEMNTTGKRDVGTTKASWLKGEAQEKTAAQDIQDQRAGKFAGGLIKIGGKIIGGMMGGPMGSAAGEAGASQNPFSQATQGFKWT